ncbi:hypothetical protein ALP72_00883 [Pseudomonas coronafaciens pv. coronafaciens]|nr:hypothetical protein HBB04_02594 [Pseudomonas coronafaciens]RMS08741.1 hypothetical protein ALP72_00883 [Pseudomonas coronafaciens pv. coronafaciens]
MLQTNSEAIGTSANAALTEAEVIYEVCIEMARRSRRQNAYRKLQPRRNKGKVRSVSWQEPDTRPKVTTR